jgi:thiamine pyrophosphate-dependent acetolactate synthase large subunit-like protein
MWELLAKAGVKRCYGIVGDALNPVIDALRRNGKRVHPLKETVFAYPTQISSLLRLL